MGKEKSSLKRLSQCSVALWTEDADTPCLEHLLLWSLSTQFLTSSSLRNHGLQEPSSIPIPHLRSSSGPCTASVSSMEELREILLVCFVMFLLLICFVVSWGSQYSAQADLKLRFLLPLPLGMHCEGRLGSCPCVCYCSLAQLDTWNGLLLSPGLSIQERVL